MVDRLVNFGDQRRLDIAYRTGALVIEGLYDGNVEAWRQRPKGDSAYARLESHPDLPIKPAELHRSLRVFDVVVRCPSLLDAEHLTLSHFVAVFPLEGAEQTRLLQLARERRWTVRQLRRVVEETDNLPAGTGRPRTPAVLKILRGALASEHAFDGVDALLALNRDEALTLLTVCRRTREAMARAELALESVGQVGREARVLVVDSNRAFTARAQRELKKHVRSVRVAHSCVQALAQVDRQIVCAAIDLHLDDGCGFELSHRLTLEYPGLKCVYMTSVNRSGLPEHLRSANPLVPKASGLHHLAAAVVRAIPIST